MRAASAGPALLCCAVAAGWAPVAVARAAAEPLLPPAEAARTFTVAPDLVFEQVLAEPLIAQPVFLNFDERGRMWVVEYRQYPHPAGLTAVSHDQYWRAVYDKTPPAPPHHYKGRDRISIHEDTDGDGTFDAHKVFLDGLSIATAVERGRGGVWVLNPPYLLFYPDENGDDAPDGEPVVHLAGFGLEDTHSVANSLRWGPDGWLYGAHGSTVTSHLTRPGVSEPELFIQGQGIWRYDPATRRCELFAEGGGNAFGVEIDAKGRLFSGHNGGDTRGFHYAQGAYLRKGFEKHGPLSNPFAFGFFDAMPSHPVERFTHNFILYDGAALPARYDGKLFGVEPLQGRIVLSEVTPEQSSFRTKDLERVVTSSDGAFRPVDIKLGPDGAIYVCDWADREVAHARNVDAGTFDLETGRVYRLRSREAKPAAAIDLGKMTSAQLLERLGAANKWTRQTALRLLWDRRETATAPPPPPEAGQRALEALWALHASDALDEPAALAALDHADPFVRLWTVRLLCDGRAVAATVGSKLIALAQTEPDLEARGQLAASARRLPAATGLEIIRHLASRDADASDNRLPLLIWWALDAKCAGHSDEVLALFESSSLWRQPLVEQHLLERLMRRFAQAGARKDLHACARLFDLSPTEAHSRRLMAGFEAAFKGRPLAGLPDELVRAMSRHGAASVALGLRQRTPAAVEQALQTLADERAPLVKRLEYAAILGEVAVAEAAPILLKLLESTRDAALRKAALAALPLYDDAAIGGRVVELFGGFEPGARTAALALLASRAGWSRQLAEAVKRGTIKTDAVPLNIVRRMKQHGEEELAQLAAELWGATGGAAAGALAERIARAATALGAGSGDPFRGQPLFEARCAACHTLFGRGGRVGPDLTAAERGDLGAMLLAIVNPNAELREGYENFFITTKDGRALNGFLADKDNQVAVLRTLDGQNLAVALADIAEMKPVGVSLMPEGLLEGLDDAQLRDLFAYLRSTQPLVPK